MPSSDIDRSKDALAVANQYLRRERPLSALVVVLVTSLFLGTYLATSLLPAVVVAAALVVVVRAPILQSRGTVRLRTDDDLEAVVDAFVGPTPPVLTFLWGVADETTVRDSSVMYHVSYLFGLRSTDVTVIGRRDTTPDGDHRVELEVTVNGQSWATHTATIGSEDGHTIVDVEYASNRRFGLRRIPQQHFARRYRDDALTAQGYTVVERDSHFGI